MTTYNYVNVGDRMVTKNPGDAHGETVMHVTGVTGKGDDALVSYTYVVGPIYKKNGVYKEPKKEKGECRMWWVRDYCIVITWDLGLAGVRM